MSGQPVRRQANDHGWSEEEDEEEDEEEEVEEE